MAFCRLGVAAIAIAIVAGSSAVLAVLLPVAIDLAIRIATGTIAIAIPITVIAGSGSVLAILLAAAAHIAVAAAAWRN